MSLGTLNRRLTKIEPVLRDAAGSDEPDDPGAAITWALDNRRLRQRHFDAWFSAIEDTLRSEIIAGAHRRHERRTRHARTNEDADPVNSAVEILSYPPQEEAPAFYIHMLEKYSSTPVNEIRPVNDPRMAALSRIVNLQQLYGLAVITILGTPDGLELRNEIWETRTENLPDGERAGTSDEKRTA